MSAANDTDISRRAFVRQTGLLAGGAILSGAVSPAAAAPSTGEIPRRVLGKTGAQVSVFTLGTAPTGFAKPSSPKLVADVLNAALDQGVNSIDTAPKYGVAEEGVGLGLGKRRKEVFLAIKVWADTIEEAETSLSNSLRLLKTDHLDLVYFHSLGHRNVDSAMKADGVFTWLVKQKKAGKTRFVGVSGHHLPGRFARFLDSGEVDVLLTVVNFVDRHTYRFEETVLPAAQQRNIGIVAMKVFGGASNKAGGYPNPKAPPEMDVKHLESAIRYSLGVPGVTTLDIGCHNVEQVRQNAEMIRRYKPLTPQEQDELTKLGKDLAAKWGPHFGPVK